MTSPEPTFPTLPPSGFTQRHDPGMAFAQMHARALPQFENRELFLKGLRDNPALRDDFLALFRHQQNCTTSQECIVGKWEAASLAANLHVNNGKLLDAVTEYNREISYLKIAGAWDQIFRRANEAILVILDAAIGGDLPLCHSVVSLSKLAWEGGVLSQGPVIDDAWNVEQGEYGISAEAPIGSHSVYDCLSVAIWDPATKKTLVAHIDDNTDPKYPEILLHSFNGRGIKARLLGVSQTSEVSRKKLWTLLNKFSGAGIEILSADLLNSASPTSWVVYPSDFSIVEAVPGISHPNRLLTPTRCYVSILQKPLMKAFDLTTSLAHNPVLIAATEIQSFKEDYTAESLPKLLLTFMASGHPFTYLTSVIETRKALNRAATPFYKALEWKLEELKISLAPDIDAAARDVIWSSTKYIGHQADEFNAPLVDSYISKLLPRLIK